MAGKHVKQVEKLRKRDGKAEKELSERMLEKI